MRLDRDEAVFSQLASDATPRLVQLLPAELKVGHYEDDGLKYEAADRQGRPLTFTTPAELRKLRVPEDVSPWNRAVLAFLLALPPACANRALLVLNRASSE